MFFTADQNWKQERTFSLSLESIGLKILVRANFKGKRALTREMANPLRVYRKAIPCPKVSQMWPIYDEYAQSQAFVLPMASVQLRDAFQKELCGDAIDVVCRGGGGMTNLTLQHIWLKISQLIMPFLGRVQHKRQRKWGENYFAFKQE